MLACKSCELFSEKKEMISAKIGKPRILFNDVLPHTTVNGVSISNQINILFLSEKFTVDIVEEFYDLKHHEVWNFIKITNFLRDLTQILKFSLKYEYSYYYSSLSLSMFGIIKNILKIFVFKIFNKGKVVLHIHRGDIDLFLDNKINYTLFSLVRRLTWKIIFLSELQRMKVSRSTKNFVLENTIEFEYDFTFKTEVSRKVKFAFISNYIENKGILILLEAFQSLGEVGIDNISLECYGEFTSDILKSQILSYESDNISFNKPLSNYEKFLKIYNSDFILLPSFNEGQPLIVLEAMSLGKPIITTKVGDIPTMLGTDYEFFVEVNSVESLYIKLLEILKNNVKLDGVSSCLKKRYFENYSRSVHRNKLLKIFEYE